MDRSIYFTSSSAGFYVENSTKTPHFHRLRNSGQKLPQNQYRWYRYDAEAPLVETYNGLQSQFAIGGRYTILDALINGSVPAPAGPAATSCTSLADAFGTVTNRLLAKIRDVDIDLGVALGEHRETAAFISSSISKVYRSYLKFRHGKISDALQILTGERNDKWLDIPNVASNSWLAYSYGLRPLINDVYGAISVFEKKNKPYVPVKTVIAKDSFDLSTTSTYIASGATYSRTMAGKLKVVGKVSFMVENPLTKSLDSFGLLNPLNVAWELVPFSFVVDWFMPIGDIISNLVPPQGVSHVNGFITGKVMDGQIHDSTRRAAPHPGWNTDSESREVFKHRDPIASIPRYHVVVPDLSLSKSQIMSGLALLNQLVR